MALHDELLAHAKSLVTADRTRPSQVHLRRAVSAAYYSVFHLLVWEATRGLDDAQRAAVARWYDHGVMKKVCGWFSLSDGSVPREIATVLGLRTPAQYRTR